MASRKERCRRGHLYNEKTTNKWMRTCTVNGKTYRYEVRACASCRSIMNKVRRDRKKQENEIRCQ